MADIPTGYRWFMKWHGHDADINYVQNRIKKAKAVYAHYGRDKIFTGEEIDKLYDELTKSEEDA